MNERTELERLPSPRGGGNRRGSSRKSGRRPDRNPESSRPRFNWEVFGWAALFNLVVISIKMMAEWITAGETTYGPFSPIMQTLWAVSNVVLAANVWILIDHFMLRELSLTNALRNDRNPPPVRAAVILGWCGILMSVFWTVRV